MDDLKLTWLLRQGDNTLILAQQLCKLCGKGPALEEDLALSNVALDLLGQTRMWLGLAAEVEGQGRTEDHLAFLRDAHQMRNCLLVEQPNGDYAHTMMRQFYFDSWHYLFLRALQQSTDHQVAAIAAKAFKEVSYHLRRSADLVVRLGDGTPDSHGRMQRAADGLWMYSGEMFVSDDIDRALAAQGVAPELEALRPPFLEHVAGVFEAATLVLPPAEAWMQRGGKQGRHSEHLGYILAEMQFLQRAYPGAAW